MRWDWPVDVCYHEAQAFAAWRTVQDGQAVSYRLITEAEHNCIRSERDRVDAYMRGPASTTTTTTTTAAAAGTGAAAVTADAAKAGSGEKGQVVVLNLTAVAAVAAPATAITVTDNMDMAMVVSGADAEKVCLGMSGRASDCIQTAGIY
jgi:hypothetical protein